MMMILMTMNLSRLSNLMRKSISMLKDDYKQNRKDWDPYLPTLTTPGRGKPLAERSKGMANGEEERAKPISAQRKEYGMKGAKNGYSTCQSVPNHNKLFTALLVGLSK